MPTYLVIAFVLIGAGIAGFFLAGKISDTRDRHDILVRDRREGSEHDWKICRETRIPRLLPLEEPATPRQPVYPPPPPPVNPAYPNNALWRGPSTTYSKFLLDPDTPHQSPYGFTLSWREKFYGRSTIFRATALTVSTTVRAPRIEINRKTLWDKGFALFRREIKTRNNEFTQQFSTHSPSSDLAVAFLNTSIQQYLLTAFPGILLTFDSHWVTVILHEGTSLKESRLVASWLEGLRDIIESSTVTAAATARPDIGDLFSEPTTVDGLIEKTDTTYATLATIIEKNPSVLDNVPRGTRTAVIFISAVFLAAGYLMLKTADTFDRLARVGDLVKISALLGGVGMFMFFRGGREIYRRVRQGPISTASGVNFIGKASTGILGAFTLLIVFTVLLSVAQASKENEERAASAAYSKVLTEWENETENYSTLTVTHQSEEQTRNDGRSIIRYFSTITTTYQKDGSFATRNEENYLNRTPEKGYIITISCTAQHTCMKKKAWGPDADFVSEESISWEQAKEALGQNIGYYNRPIPAEPASLTAFSDAAFPQNFFRKEKTNTNTLTIYGLHSFVPYAQITRVSPGVYDINNYDWVYRWTYTIPQR